MNGRFKIHIIATLCLLIGSLSFQIIEGLSPSEKRGKLIYTKGLRSSGVPIQAQLSGAKFNAKILPCANCHGQQGIGNPEGGIEPSPLVWSILTKPYTIEFKNGRKRIAYDKNSFKRVIEKGLDPSNNKLDPIMPHYTLNEEDINDLIAYLKIIGKENPIGITERKIEIGIILPPKDNPAGQSIAVSKTVSAYLDLINSGGGIFNRIIQLNVLYLENDVERNMSLIDDFINKNEFFSLVACDLEGLSQKEMNVLEKNGIPIIGAISGNPMYGNYFDNEFYYLMPGINREIDGLIEFAYRELGAKKSDFVVLLDNSIASNLSISLDQIQASQKAKILDLNMETQDLSTLVRDLKKQGIKNCVFLGDPVNAMTFFAEANKLNWIPNILTSNKIIGLNWHNLPTKFNNKFYISYPTWDTERNIDAIFQYNEMAKVYELEEDSKDIQYNSLASIILFTEVLKMTGKNVSRQSFITKLHEQKRFETGFISTLSFSPNKRIGTETIFIAKVDLISSKLNLIK